MARLELSFLGSFSARLDGNPIRNFASDKVRALLAYLAVEAACPQSRARLAELFWPDRSPGVAAADLRNALTNLRRSLPSPPGALPYLAIDRETVQFTCASDCQVDVRSFSDELAAAQFWQDHSDDFSEAVQRYQSAAGYYRGPFLDGLSLKDCPEFDDWCYFERERLRGQASSALARLAGYYEGCLEYGQAIACARRCLELEPWQEAAHSRLMRLYALNGQAAEALEQFQLCRQKLQEELAVEPSPETVRLYESIRAGGFDQLPPEKPFGMPAYLTPLVGREKEQAMVQARLLDPSCRLLTLAGPGGCGKTRLGVAAASGLEGNFPDGVHFVPLVTLAQPEGIPSAILQALGAANSSNGGPGAALIDHLRGKGLLLLLDNFEQLLLEGTEILGGLLGAVPGLKLLVTSRERLHAAEEWVFPLEGLQLPDSACLEEAHSAGSIQLFSQALQRQRGAPLAETELPAAVRICRSVSGMPLAIEIAAGWSRLLSCVEISAEIERSLAFLSTDARLLQNRHRSVQAVFEATWAYLARQERSAFCRLSVFRGGFTRQAAGEVAGASLPILTSLVDKCLVLCRPSGRFELHELLRQFAAEKLELDPLEVKDALDQHAAYYCRLAKGFDFSSPQVEPSVTGVGQEHANLLAAYERFLTLGEYESANWLVGKLCSYYGHHAFNTAIADLTGGFLERLPVAFYADCRVQALRARAESLVMLGREAEGLQCYQECLDIYTALGQDRDVFWTRGLMTALLGGDRYQEAIRTYEDCIAYLDECGQHEGLPYLNMWMGDLCLERGLVTRAAAAFEQGLAIARRLADLRWIGISLNWLGLARLAQGRLEEAEACFIECADRFREAGIPGFGEAYRLGGLARVARARGRLDEALRLIEGGIAVWQEVIRAGNDVNGLLRQSMLQRCEIIGAREGPGEMRAAVSQALQAFQDHPLQPSLVFHKGRALYLRARAEISLADFSAARADLRGALRIFQAEHYTDWLLFSLVAWSDLLVQEGPERLAQALELLASLLAHPRMAEIEFHPAGLGRAEVEAKATALTAHLPISLAEDFWCKGRAEPVESIIERIITVNPY